MDALAAAEEAFAANHHADVLSDAGDLGARVYKAVST
jgi:hypothetical protein